MKRPATQVADLLNPAAMLLPASDVIMQLAVPGVGYGVLESPVDSGLIYKHPFKRARTTGLPGEWRPSGRNRPTLIELPWTSRTGKDSIDGLEPRCPITPSFEVAAVVAACLYRYFVDQHEFLYGPLEDATDAVYKTPNG